MTTKRFTDRTTAILLSLVSTLAMAPIAAAQPEVVDPDLSVRTVVDGLVTPITMAFAENGDFFLLEKNTGKVKFVQRSSTPPVVTEVLDLAVNFASERGLLGIDLHPEFPANTGVYLYWTCRTEGPPSDPFFPDVMACPDDPAVGEDTGDVLSVPLLGNRVDRFDWDGASLVFTQNLVKLRAFQNDGAPVPPGQEDETQRPAGNHDGGVIRFGPDGKLYVIIGDVGRRGVTQNLLLGPTPPLPDDQFGGPEPDDAHLTGVILRLNEDGTAPEDNPFFRLGSLVGGEVGANIQRIFAYGIRNSFGMAFDPLTGSLWTAENGDDSFDEINRIFSGANGGWIQVQGPLRRLDEYKAIETSDAFFGLQQQRWPPTRIADRVARVFARLVRIPRSRYNDPELSWKFAVAPAAMGFLASDALGARYRGSLFVGAAIPVLEGGYLFRFDLTRTRRALEFDDPRLRDRVADNDAKFDIQESESLLFGRNFGSGTDIRTGPDGNLYVVSLTEGAVFEIFRP